MRKNLSLAPRPSQHLGLLLATTLGIIANPLLFAAASSGQTSASMPSLSSGQTEVNPAANSSLSEITDGADETSTISIIEGDTSERDTSPMSLDSETIGLTQGEPLLNQGGSHIDTQSSTSAQDLMEFNRLVLVEPLSSGEGAAPSILGLQNEADELTVPPGNGEVISDIQVRFVDKDGVPTEGKTRPYIITREFDLQPGDVYDPELALKGLEHLNNLFILRRASLTLEPAADPDQVVMVVTVDEQNRFFFRFGLTLPPPTALQGPARPVTVIPQSNRARGLSNGVRVGVLNLGGNNQSLTFGLEGGVQSLGFDIDFRQYLRNDSGWAVNFANRRGVEPEFDGGDNDVDTKSGNDPWVHRLGGGFEYFRPLTPHLNGALGIAYQQVSVRDAAFQSDIDSEDELGNPLTVSDDGIDDLLYITFAGAYDRRDDSLFPTEGYRILFETNQSIPVGDADILANRISANYTQFIPLNLFGFTEGPRTLVFNLQGGTIIGDTPPYEAFSLGGGSSVRGYSSGELGTGKSFIQTTVEYRFPIFSFVAFQEDIDVGGGLFFDYANDLGSGDDVIGTPAEVRDKPGDGFGYGVGLRARTPVGPMRLEVGINDEGDAEVVFRIGDRY